MSTPVLAGWRPFGDGHPVVAARRRRERATIAASALIPLAVAAAISVSVPKPNVLLAVAIALGGVAVVALMAVPRYEVTLTVVALYLGLLDGPVKLGSGSHTVGSAARDVLIASIAIGALGRLAVNRRRVELPALAVWPLVFVALVVVEAFNPNTSGLTKVLGGFRQQLEWVPFFFFGYAVMRSRARFRRMLLLLGVLALVNGAVAIYQSRIGPGGLAGWGPGYAELAHGSETTGGISGRTYYSEGEARIRPPALGSDSGFGAGVGVIGLLGGFALLAVGPLRRRWPAIILALGAMLAIVTGTGRLQLVGGLFALLAFIGLSFTGRRVSRPLAALLAVLVLAVPVFVAFVSLEGASSFSRYTDTKGSKAGTLEHIPAVIKGAPFGIGLGTVGAAAGFGGHQSTQIEGKSVSSETEYNFITDELGLPGLVLWVAFAIRLFTLVLPRLRLVRDFELRLYLTAVTATLIAFTLMGLGGPTMTSAAFGPFFWFAAGTLAYWFAGPGWSQTRLQVAP